MSDDPFTDWHVHDGLDPDNRTGHEHDGFANHVHRGDTIYFDDGRKAHDPEVIATIRRDGG